MPILNPKSDKSCFICGKLISYLRIYCSKQCKSKSQELKINFGKANTIDIYSMLKRITKNENIILKDFETGNYLPYFCAIKREKLLEIGGYSPKMIWGWEDLHLWINLLSRGAIVKTIPKVLVLYRTKEKSMWTDSKDHAEELQAQINKDFPTIF